MKNLALPMLVVILGAAIVSAVFAGCGQSNVATSSNSIFSGSCTGTGCSTNNPIVGGDTETLNIASIYALSEYAGVSIQNPTDIVVNINLTPIQGTPTVYLGEMIIQFNDGAVAHQGTFVNGTSVTTWRNYSNNVSTLVGNTYRIFFEDPMGALVLTVIPPTGTDTVASSTGQIWFSNFNAAGAPNPLYQGAYDQNGTYYPPGYVFCWMIDIGPYDCRNFAVPPSSAYYDSGGQSTVPAFSYLGSIPTINLNVAFGL
jgi:hypothetical protein